MPLQKENLKRTALRSPVRSEPKRVKTVSTPAPPVVTPTARSSARIKDRVQVRNDELGKYVREHTALLEQCGFEATVRRIRPRGDLEVNQRHWHPASPLLRHFAKCGVPAVMSTAPWSPELLEARALRGSHQSCDEYLDFVREELLDFVKKGFWMVLPYRLVKHMRHLRLSPLGVVPQRERRPRLIVDYTFYGVNDDTLPLAPKEAMQFGRALDRILYHIRHANPRFGPVYMSKIDLSDGFYRVGLNHSAIPKLGVIFPKYDDEEQLVAFPLTLPMGWVSSPPYFCSATETVADLANALPKNAALPPHPLEHLAATVPADLVPDPPDPLVQSTMPPVIRPYQKPLDTHDIYADDYVNLIQGPPRRRKQHLRRILHSIDQVFRPLESSDPPIRQHVPSTKKMRKGDACALTRKIVLGWLIDALRGTLELPEHRQLRLIEIFDYLRGRRRVGISKWHKILGELRSMALGIPGSRGFFGALQCGLRYADKHRVSLTKEIRDQLADFELLCQDLAARPTSIAELVPDHPISVGPHDASGLGMGGCWLPAVNGSTITPFLWRSRFPQAITDSLVSDDNPQGTVTNSDLELAGMIAHADTMVQQYDCAGRTLVPLGDNIPSVAWSLKGSVSTFGSAGYLLSLYSLHQRHFRYLAKADYISGDANRMADDCSRLWHLSDAELLTYFNSTYPQATPWRIVPLRSAMHSSLISALMMKRPTRQFLLNAPETKTVIGASGRLTAKSSASTATSAGSNRSFLFSRFSQAASVQDPSAPAATLSELVQWRSTYAPSARRSPAWGPRPIHGSA